MARDDTGRWFETTCTTTFESPDIEASVLLYGAKIQVLANGYWESVDPFGIEIEDGSHLSSARKEVARRPIGFVNDCTTTDVESVRTLPVDWMGSPEAGRRFSG